MKAKGSSLLMRCVTGALFFLCPVCMLLGLAQISFADGEWITLSRISVLFGGEESIQNAGVTYCFSYRLDPFYIALISVGFLAALSVFFSSNNRKSLLFSLILGVFELGIAATSILSFCWLNPGFSLDGIRGGAGFVLSLVCVSSGLILLVIQLVLARVKKR